MPSCFYWTTETCPDFVNSSRRRFTAADATQGDVDAHHRAVYIRIHNPKMGRKFYYCRHNSFAAAAAAAAAFAAVAAAAAAPPPFDYLVPGRLTDRPLRFNSDRRYRNVTAGSTVSFFGT